MTYTPYYPTWIDSPSTSTPITAAALNNMEAGLLATSGQVYNPLSFGAKGDGTTADDTAIANAIASIPVSGGILDLSGAPVSYGITSPIVLKSGASVVGTFINNQDVATGANKTDVVALSSFAGAAMMGDAGALATGFSATVSSATISGVVGSALFTATGSTFAANARVSVGATTMPGNFTQGVDYFAIPVGTGTFGLAATSGGTPIAFSSAGTAVTVIAAFGCSLPVTVRGVSIDMSNVPSGQTPDGILLMTFRSIVESCFIRGNPTAPNSGSGIRFTDRNLGWASINNLPDENAARRNWITCMNGPCIMVDRTTGSHQLTDGYVEGNLLEQRCTVLGDAFSSSGPALDIESAADWQVIGNHCYRCPNDAMVLNHAFTSFVMHNKIDNFGLSGAASTTYHGIWVNAAVGPPTVLVGNEVDNDESHGSATTNYHYYEINAVNAGFGVVMMAANGVRKTADNPNAGGSVVLATSGTGGGSLTIDDTSTKSVATGTATPPSMALSKSGVVNSLRGPLPSGAFFNPANPTATASLTQVMMGLGSTCTYTPVLTGRVRIRIVGEMITNTGATACAVSGRYGTGTAPANGAALTGTVFGQGTINIVSAPASVYNRPFVTEHIVSGLTLGTPIWVDCGADTTNAADTAAPGALAITIEEIN